MTASAVLASVLCVAAGWASAAEPASPPAAAVATAVAVADREVVNAPADEPPHHVRRHYLWSNERRHDLFFADLRPQGSPIGGGYLGVGGDQNYTLAAAAGVDVLWLIDLDASVVYMHRLYAALLAVSPTAKEFVARFDGRARESVHEAVLARYSDAAERRAVLETYHAYRDLLRDHLGQALRLRRGRTWLSDPDKYRHLRELALGGRLVARLGDLTGPRTVVEIADAAKRAGVPVRVVYLSNAESWFHYGPAFRHNFTALPFDDRSVILRTIKSDLLRYPSGDIWHYTVQRATHFAQNLGDPAYRSIDVAMTDAVPDRTAGISHVGFSSAKLGPLLAEDADEAGSKSRGKGHRESRRELISAGIVTRPEGNRERANEMDRDRKRRAALELARSSIP